MKGKKECKIVQDLLPNYIEKLTNEETNTYIDEHLNSCEGCKKVLESMKKDIKTLEPKRQEKEVKFLKKYNRKIRILSSIVIAIIIIYGILLIRNVAILSSLTKKAYTIWDSNNMHTTIYSHSGGNLSIVESYYTYGKRLMKITKINNKETVKLTEYVDEEKNITYIENGENKIAYIKPSQLNVIITPRMYFENPYELIFMAATSLITKAECNGEDCYFINTWGLKEYYSKETGLTVRDMSVRSTTEEGTFDEVVDYKYEFGTVKTKELTPPDISEYKIIE